MSLDGLRRTAGVEATQSGIVVGRLSTGAGELEEIPLASLSDGIAAATAFAQTFLDDANADDVLTTLGLSTALADAAIAVTGSKGANAALTSLIAALVTMGLITDGTS